MESEALVTSALHSKESPNWGTPGHIVELGREVLGGIYHDPCTSAYWNRHVVHASFYTDEEGDALSVPDAYWTGPVLFGEPRTFFVNPPGGLVRQFWDFCIRRFREGHSVFWVGFSLEQMLYLQGGELSLFHTDIKKAIPRTRIPFLMDRETAVKKLLERVEKAKKKDASKRVVDNLLAKVVEYQDDLDGPPVVGDSPTHGCYLALLTHETAIIDRWERCTPRLSAAIF